MGCEHAAQQVENCGMLTSHLEGGTLEPEQWVYMPAWITGTFMYIAIDVCFCLLHRTVWKNVASFLMWGAAMEVIGAKESPCTVG